MKNNKTTELAANTNLAGWKIISRIISQRARTQGGPGVQTVQYLKFETDWPGCLPSAFSTRTLFIFAKTPLSVTSSPFIVGKCDHMMIRHAADTSHGGAGTRHVTSGVTLSGITRLRVGHVAVRKIQDFIEDEKKEREETNGHNKSC